MKLSVCVFMTFLLCSFHSYGGSDFKPFENNIRAKVIRIIDGDTIEVLHGQNPVRVRLANIDAPEKKQPFGRWSAEQLKALVAAQPVTVGYDQKDRYGRVLGHVETKYADVNRSMVIIGAAWIYDQYNTDDSLPALQREAQGQKRGLWADSAPVAPWEWRDRKTSE